MAVASKNILNNLSITAYSSLLSFLRQIEAVSNSYSSVSREPTPKPLGDLTKRTISEIKNDPNLQGKALRAYQIQNKYLLSAYAPNAGLTGNDLFSANNQDLMAVAAIENKIQKFREQKDNDLKKYSEELCRIWEALPVLFETKGYDPYNEKKTDIDVVRGQTIYVRNGKGVFMPSNGYESRASKYESILQLINPNAESASLSQGESNLSVGIQPVTSSFIPPPDLVLTPEEEAEILSGIESPFSPSSPIPESQYLQFIQN